MMLHAPRRHRSDGGFTLIELAVVVFVIALILGGILVPLSSQVEQRQIAEAQRQLEEIKEALIGFAIANRYLPCPDYTGAGPGITPNDGLEDVTGGGGCVLIANGGAEGNLPWATLGVQATDPWGNRYRYRVTALFAQRTPAANFSLDTDGNLRFCTSSACTEMLSMATISKNSPIAMVLSHGPNGWGGINSETNALILPPGCAGVSGCAGIGGDEQANADATFTTGAPPLRTFVSRAPSPSTSTAGQFDDIVTWLSPHILKNRMVAAGKLP
jgi:prepilin-type N-terminal cleavage/methylation domain-containing protein